jgi:hypothetical protein
LGAVQEQEYVKENVAPRAPVPAWVVCAALAGAAAVFALAALPDLAMPEPLTRAAPPHRFIAEIAYEHMVNLTSIGPRVHNIMPHTFRQHFISFCFLPFNHHGHIILI